MTQPVGGIRARLIWDNMFYLVQEVLTDLGWFNPGRAHAPINLVAEPVDDQVEMPKNTLAVVGEDISSIEQELGSNLAEHPWTFWIDFFAEDDIVGVHLIRDLVDALEGRMESIGRSRPILSVLDYRMPTPAEIFTCTIEDVQVSRGRIGTQMWRRYWHAASLTVTDVYGGENG